MNADQVSAFAHYLSELDALKTVNRRSYIQGGTRLENSAEHSWHLAMACWTLSEFLDDDYDMEALLKMALVHDVGEVDAGDTFLYSAARKDAAGPERECVLRFGEHPGNPAHDFVPLWDEQETGTGKETRLLKVVDRLLPFMLNVNSQGRAWIENGVAKSQVLAAHAFIADEIPALHRWMANRVEEAVANGWLKE
ncbi:HD domain-containing protein [Marinimicrobium sp. ARAG 43.8]|uniref:HD domain-containing protein n=1 Tax=Marinimicrobium sp. ARAG 43.8 TaxID=3418719 RepID=UPI003CF4037B